MRPTVFSASRLRQFLRRCRIATLPQLKQLLGTEADITVFRKLKELSYRCPYRNLHPGLKQLPLAHWWPLSLVCIPAIAFTVIRDSLEWTFLPLAQSKSTFRGWDASPETTQPWTRTSAPSAGSPAWQQPAHAEDRLCGASLIAVV